MKIMDNVFLLILLSSPQKNLELRRFFCSLVICIVYWREQTGGNCQRGVILLPAESRVLSRQKYGNLEF